MAVLFFWSGLLGALVVSTVFQSTLVDMKNGTLPFFRLALSATGSASAENSSPAIRCTTLWVVFCFFRGDEARNELRLALCAGREQHAGGMLR